MTKIANRRSAQAAAGTNNEPINSGNIHHLNLPAERAKAEAAYTRRIIKQSNFTSLEREILIVLSNFWFRHRSGPKGYIHPGRKMIANKTKASVVTVSRALSVFRNLGLIHPINHLKGGNGCATQYTLNIRAIWDLIDPDYVQMIPGDLKFIRRPAVSATVSLEGLNDTVAAYQNDTLSLMTYDPAYDIAGDVETSAANVEDQE